MLDLTWDIEELSQCQTLYNQLPQEDKLFYNHYELTEVTGFGDSELWKTFLVDQRVSDWLTKELQLYKEVQMRKLIKNATDNDKSVGAAQMINALSKVVGDDKKKEGDLIVYSYVPMNARETQAPNVIINKKDLFA